MMDYLENIFHSINITEIIKNHFKSLQGKNDKIISTEDLFVFFIIPILITSIIQYYSLYLKESIVNIMIASLSILAGFLLNLLAIIFGLKDKILNNLKRQKHDKTTIENKRLFLKHLYANISYNILVSIIAIIFLLLSLLPVKIIGMISSVISMTLIINFTLTMFMILKRIFIVFKIDNFVDEFEDNENNE